MTLRLLKAESRVGGWAVVAFRKVGGGGGGVQVKYCTFMHLQATYFGNGAFKIQEQITFTRPLQLKGLLYER